MEHAVNSAWRSRANLIFLAVLLSAFVAAGLMVRGWIAESAASSLRHEMASLMNQADRLAEDLELELSFMEESLRPDEAEFWSRDGAAFAEDLRKIREQARWPDLLEAAWFLPSGFDPSAAFRFDPAASAFLPLAPGDPLSAALDGLAASSGSAGPGQAADLLSRLSGRGSWRIIGVQDGHEPANFATASGRLPGRSPGYLLLKLDDEVLITTVLPELGRRYFGPSSDFGSFFVRAVDQDRGRVLPLGQSQSSKKASDPWDRADFGRVLLSRRSGMDIARLYAAARDPDGIPGDSRWPMASPEPPPYGGEGADGRFSRTFPIDAWRYMKAGSHSGWILQARHRSGSIEQADRLLTGLETLLAFAFLAALYALIAGLLISARRAGELAARERAFVASVSHELKTPIAVILSAADNLGASRVGPERTDEYGKLLSREGKRLRDAVESILLMSGIQSSLASSGTETFRLDEALAQAVSAQEAAAAERSVTLSSAARARPLIKASKALVCAAVNSLLSNAIKYGPAGGTVVATLVSVKRRGRRFAELTVEDSGPGIAASERRKLFSAFWRGAAARESNQPGTGLGLHLARRIARMNGGDIIWKARAGGGSAFTLSIQEEMEA